MSYRPVVVTPDKSVLQGMSFNGITGDNWSREGKGV